MWNVNTQLVPSAINYNTEGGLIQPIFNLKVGNVYEIESNIQSLEYLTFTKLTFNREILKSNNYFFRWISIDASFCKLYRFDITTNNYYYTTNFLENTRSIGNLYYSDDILFSAKLQCTINNVSALDQISLLLESVDITDIYLRQDSSEFLISSSYVRNNLNFQNNTLLFLFDFDKVNNIFIDTKTFIKTIKIKFTTSLTFTEIQSIFNLKFNNKNYKRIDNLDRYTGAKSFILSSDGALLIL